MATDLIVYKRQQWKLHEASAIAFANQTGDWDLMQRVILSALPQQRGIPMQVLNGGSNFSSAKQCHDEFKRRVGVQQGN
jgi:tripartite-type tricarboxylate transporter receptor subunit TctC